jgi:Na+/glutamate symporter
MILMTAKIRGTRAKFQGTLQIPNSIGAGSVFSVFLRGLRALGGEWRSGLEKLFVFAVAFFFQILHGDES